MAKNRSIKHIIKKRIVINSKGESRIENNIKPKPTPKLISTPSPKKLIRIFDPRARKQIIEPKGLSKHEKRDYKRSGIINGVAVVYPEIKNLKNYLNNEDGLSIIVTAYNVENYIEECLDSIENQTFFINSNSYEILVGVDDSQKTLDKLIKIRHKYRNLRIFMMESNKGTYITSNTLLSLIKFSKIIRFDSDDIMKSNMVGEIMKHSNHDLIRFYFDHFEVKNGEKKYTDIKYHAKGVLFYKTSLLGKLGGYMPWECSADADFIKRAESLVNEKLINIPLFDRRLHENNLIYTYGGDSSIRKKYDSLVGKHTSIKINREINNFNEIVSIPKKMIFFWSGDNFPWVRYITLYTFKKLNPDWEVILLYDGNLNNLNKNGFELLNNINLTIIKASLPPEILKKINNLKLEHKSDLYRYYYLYESGGFYCDTDVLFFRPIKDFYDTVVRENYDTIIHKHLNNTLTIGLLGASKHNKYFGDLLNFGVNHIDNKTNDNYQSMGVLLIYKMLGRVATHQQNKLIIEDIKSKYKNLKILNFSTNLIYQYDHNKIIECYEKGKYLEDFDSNAIGYHWYGGHPESKKYENLLNESNYNNYNTTFTNILKQII